MRRIQILIPCGIRNVVQPIHLLNTIIIRRASRTKQKAPYSQC
ncbi:MAG: hypothetical protein SOW57_07135 [Prevotella sp.]|nr:hypothetical protein [Prevotella sp.]